VRQPKLIQTSLVSKDIIMAGLFANPQDVALAEQQAQRSQRPQDILRGSLFNLGQQGGNVLRRQQGEETRSPAQLKAIKLQELAKTIDFKDPESITTGMNTMNENGFQAEAFKLLEALPAPVKAQKQVVDEWIQTEKIGGSQKKFLFQRDNFGFITKAGEVSDKADSSKGSLFKFDSSFQSDVNFDEDSRGSFLGRVANLPEFKSLVDDTDPEQMEQFTGLVQKVANDLKDSHRDQIGQAFESGQITAQKANLLTSRSDDFYLNEAYNRFKRGGGFGANIDTGFGIGGADVELSASQDTTDPATLQGNEARVAAKKKAVADVASRVDQLMVADPRTGGFRLNKMTPQQATEAFSRMDGKTDEALQAQLESQGFQFTPELFESHAQRWQLMRENPVATAKFLSLNDSPDLQAAEVARHLSDLDDNNNFQSFATSAEIFKYLGRLSTPAKKKTSSALGRVRR